MPEMWGIAPVNWDDATVRCDGCGAELAESGSTKPEQRKPCPKCGSLERKIVVHQDVNLRWDVSGAARQLIDAAKPEYEAPIKELDAFLRRAPLAIVVAVLHAASAGEVGKVCGKLYPIPLTMIVGLAKAALDARGKGTETRHGYLRIIATAITGLVCTVLGAAIGKYLL